MNGIQNLRFMKKFDSWTLHGTWKYLFGGLILILKDHAATRCQKTTQFWVVFYQTEKNNGIVLLHNSEILVEMNKQVDCISRKCFHWEFGKIRQLSNCFISSFLHLPQSNAKAANSTKVTSEVRVKRWAQLTNFVTTAAAYCAAKGGKSSRKVIQQQGQCHRRKLKTECQTVKVTAVKVIFINWQFSPREQCCQNLFNFSLWKKKNVWG